MSASTIFGVDLVLDEESVLGRLSALRPSAIGTATELFKGERWPALVAQATRWSRAALELSALSPNELDSAIAYLRRSPPRVRQLSLHAPLALLDYGEERLAARISEIGSPLGVVVQHPHILEKPRALVSLGRRLALENMDVEKPDARAVAELDHYFRTLPNARFCLDLAHVKTVDPTMELGHALLDAFGARLCEVHVSGIDGDCNHVALELADVEAYAGVLGRCRHVPWILESLPADAPAT